MGLYTTLSIPCSERYLFISENISIAADVVSEDYTRLRIFGKHVQHVGRRMGVVLCYGDKDADTTPLRDKAKRLAETVIK